MPSHAEATGTLLGFIRQERREEPLVSPRRPNHTWQPSKAGEGGGIRQQESVRTDDEQRLGLLRAAEHVSLFAKAGI